MADEVGLAGDIAERVLERTIAASRAPIPAGAPGDCRQCDAYSPRLVYGRCAPCRDGRPRC